jgi:protocatechuate 3,4-dioxygenase beta subunit
MIRLAIFLTLVPAFSFVFITADAQTPQRDNRPRSASIGGRVTIAGKPATNAKITITELNRDEGNPFMHVSGSRAGEVYKANTDADGRYRILNLPEAKYEVQAMLGNCVREKPSPNESLVESVSLDEGAARVDVDFALVRGGVITGRVTDADGRPMIARVVSLQIVDEQGRKQEYSNHINREAFYTDDRGVYRIYGLRAGRYLVSAGGINDNGLMVAGAGEYQRTWHPGTTSENQARFIEVKEGGEVASVDIKLGVAKNTYEALGRAVDDETGQPVAGASLICVKTKGDEGSFSQFGGNIKTDHEGNFRFDGLTAGQYQLSFADYESLLTGKGSDYYSEGAKFEIQGGDVSGVEIRAKRGSTISGVVVVEDADPSAKSALPQTMILAHSMPTSLDGRNDAVFTPGMLPTFSRIGSDGSFLIKGVRPGKVTLNSQSVTDRLLIIARIERDGADVTDGIVITGRENVSGVRIILGKGSCVIRGQAQVTGGALPEGWQMTVMASSERDGGTNGFVGQAEVDNKGRFVIEGLLPGEYQLVLMARPEISPNSPPAPALNMPAPVTQKVVVTKGQEAQVTMTLDLSKKNQKERR